MKFLIRYFLGILFIVLFFSEVNAQIYIPDSIQNYSNKDKAIYLNNRADNHTNLDSMIVFTNEAIGFSSKCKCDSIHLASNFNKAYFQYHSGKYNKAIKQLNYLDSINSPMISDFYHFKTFELFASLYAYIDEQEKGLEYSKKTLDFAIQLNDSLKIADAYYNLGYMYNANEMLKKAKDYHSKALEIYLNLGSDYKKLFPVYTGLRQVSSTYEEFITYNKKCFSLINADDLNSIIYLHVTASTILLDNDFNIEEAKHNANIGLRLADSINYAPLKKIALYNLGFIENKLGNYKDAIPYFEESISTIESSSQSHVLLLNGLSESYAKTNKYKKALEYKEKIVQLKDSIHQAQSVAKFAEFDVQFKTAEKDKEIAEQELEIEKHKNKRTSWIFGSIALFLIALGLFQWFSSRQKRKKLAVELELQKEQEINELRTKFLGNIAHEIRTPLTLISGNLDLALENYEQKEKAIQNIKTALSNSKKVVEDANEILELLKFEKNKTTIKLNPVNLNEVLKRIFYTFKSLAEIKHLGLIYQSNISENYSTKFDIEKVEKILNNLISNAIKYSPANSKIIFNAELIEEDLVVKVTDYGQGIHFNETEKIFQRFYQSSQSNAVGGIGIGLSLAKEFAELLSGNLTVESELTKGSTFIFTLPISEIDSIDISENKDSKTGFIPEETIKEINKITTQKPKILIVEDNPEMCNYMVEILSQSYDCSTAFDGEEALLKIRKNAYDLITSDIMMPKMDGFQLREKLNEDQKFKYIPFILISAKTLEEDKVKGFNLGINDYIIKPFNKIELIARIKNLLINKNSREKWMLQQENLHIDTESSEAKLLKKIELTVIENLSNENFKISDLAKNVGYSQRQLTRILKQHTGMSPVKFILEIRLQKAYQLLQNKTFYTLSEVRYDVGITSSPYFNKKFKERFGLNPSELLS